MLIHGGHRPSPSPIPLSEILERGDLILLLTPIVPPAPSPAGAGGAGGGGSGTQDPFEPLGRALARYHPWVRHVPYTPRGGITSTHAGFIRRARAVVFVISGPRAAAAAAAGQPSQVELFGVARAIGGEGRPHAVVACCDVAELGPAAAELPAVVQVLGYGPRDLEAAAGLLFFGGQQLQLQLQQQQQRQRPEEPGPGPGSGPAPAPAVQLPGIASLQQPPGGAGDDTTALAPIPIPIPAPAPAPAPQQQQQQHRWIIQEWDEIRDLPAVHALWQTCMPRQFGATLSRPALQRLLQRDGYAKHFVARTSSTGGVVIGFCATYTTYLDSKDDVLVGSVAALLVREDHRNRGAGGQLHAEALRGFRKTRGVSRLQLGSTFPRLLYGLPVGCPAEGWFARRGWRMDRTAPGTGHEVADWVLAFGEWPAGEAGFPPVAGLSFRPCGFADFEAVLGIVEGQSGGGGRGNMAWYDQYAKLAESPCMGDIVVALRGVAVVAAAITYVVNSENSSAEDIPWARTISDDTGGVTCICITGTYAIYCRAALGEFYTCLNEQLTYLLRAEDDPATRDSVMVRLLDACVKVLRQQGMNRMYIDAVKGGEAGFQAIGFQKWASYMDVWRDA
ncbi:hypothetical protein VPNG_10337 [Cytospora leucostoma]|uniref:N-acetyltransferase domain-containing protein n=1 Tax=Cytospora leucostoma TaxID=1230097 RepID=A0A423VAN9_9PEZI|nr:hypothetical protein VPNG_10337 [Cytospora leucostoma]